MDTEHKKQSSHLDLINISSDKEGEEAGASKEDEPMAELQNIGEENEKDDKKLMMVDIMPPGKDEDDWAMAEEPAKS